MESESLRTAPVLVELSNEELQEELKRCFLPNVEPMSMSLSVKVTRSSFYPLETWREVMCGIAFFHAFSD